MNFNSIASPAQLALQYKNVKLKLINTIHNIKFNKDCLKYDLRPKYVQVKIKNQSSSAKRTLSMAQLFWVKNEIKSLYCKKNLLNKLLLQKYLQLSNSVHPIHLDCILNEVETSVAKIIRIKKSKLRKKHRAYQF